MRAWFLDPTHLLERHTHHVLNGLIAKVHIHISARFSGYLLPCLTLSEMLYVSIRRSMVYTSMPKRRFAHLPPVQKGPHST